MDLGKQFNDYMFETAHDTDSNITSAVASLYKKGRFVPKAVMRIDGSQKIRNKQEQDLINSGYIEHGVGVDSDTGQMKWTGGTMDNAAVDHVSWLAMDTDGTIDEDEESISPRQQSHLLRGIIGTSVHAHGSIPYADKHLTQDGSRISKALNRRYGVKPHPDNPEMKKNTMSMGWGDDDFSYFRKTSPGTWKTHSNEEVSEGIRFLKSNSSSIKAEKAKAKTKKREDPQLPGMED
jgi:hypothetical protein